MTNALRFDMKMGGAFVVTKVQHDGLDPVVERHSVTIHASKRGDGWLINYDDAMLVRHLLGLPERRLRASHPELFSDPEPEDDGYGR